VPLVCRRSSDGFAIEGKLFVARKERILFRIEIVVFPLPLRSSLSLLQRGPAEYFTKFSSLFRLLLIISLNPHSSPSKLR
jgi:hypothetical protein